MFSISIFWFMKWLNKYNKSNIQLPNGSQFEPVTKEHCILESLGHRTEAPPTLKATGKFVEPRNLKTSVYTRGLLIISYAWQDRIANHFSFFFTHRYLAVNNWKKMRNLVHIMSEETKMFSDCTSLWQTFTQMLLQCIVLYIGSMCIGNTE